MPTIISEKQDEAADALEKHRKEESISSMFRYAESFGDAFTAGTPLQYSFLVPHDVSGLIELHEGKEKFEEELDYFFYNASKAHGSDWIDDNQAAGAFGGHAQGLV